MHTSSAPWQLNPFPDVILRDLDDALLNKYLEDLVPLPPSHLAAAACGRRAGKSLALLDKLLHLTDHPDKCLVRDLANGMDVL
eukprot:4254795-Amphidinium_carterae.1